MFVRLIAIILTFNISFNFTYGQLDVSPKEQPDQLKDTIFFRQIVTDSLFDSNQIISILSIKKNSKKYKIRFVYSSSELKGTSEFAEENSALAAINGGFFDMDKGGSVTYFEMNDTVINRNISKKNKWGKPKNLMNGVVILDKNDSIIIDYAKQEQFYETSKDENTVLVAGPVLYLNSKPVEMPDLKFVKKRHPRTCLCTTDDSVVFITIDGRSKNAHGMNLYEVQDFLNSLKCIDAINLDGGGSTTMWIKDKGIVNNPSDKKGERPVANALLIVED